MTSLALKVIRIDGGTQPRAELSREKVAEYREAMELGAKFPPVVVFHDGVSYWLADGFHRVHAVEERGAARITVEVRQGSQRDAILYSVGANAAHGLPRSNTDKRRAVERLLSDDEWSQWSDREIARRCAVSDRFVNNVRKELSANRSQMDEPAPRKATRKGTTYTQRRRHQQPRAPQLDIVPTDNLPDASDDEDEDRFDPESAALRVTHAIRTIVAKWPDDDPSYWIGTNRLREVLQAAGCTVPLDAIASWTQAQRREAEEWAALRAELARIESDAVHAHFDPPAHVADATQAAERHEVTHGEA